MLGFGTQKDVVNFPGSPYEILQRTASLIISQGEEIATRLSGSLSRD